MIVFAKSPVSPRSEVAVALLLRLLRVDRRLAALGAGIGVPSAIVTSNGALGVDGSGLSAWSGDSWEVTDWLRVRPRADESIAEDVVLMPRVLLDGCRPDRVCDATESGGSWDASFRDRALRFLVSLDSIGSGDCSLSLIGLTSRELGLVGEEGTPVEGAAFHFVSAVLMAVMGLWTGVFASEGVASIFEIDKIKG